MKKRVISIMLVAAMSMSLVAIPAAAEESGFDWKAYDGTTINVLFNDPENYIAPEDAGESLDELYARTGSFLEEVIKPLHEAGKDVLIVGHGALNSCILTQAKGLPRKDFWSHGIVQCRLMTLM